MTRNQEMAESWPDPSSAKPGEIKKFPVDSSGPSPKIAQANLAKWYLGLGAHRNTRLLGEPADKTRKDEVERGRKQGGRWGWPMQLFWWSLMLLIPTGMGVTATALLLKLPALPNCPGIFWPTASASLRLYCAQVAANKQTANDLLEAIALVNEVAPDHPLRSSINAEIKQWSQDLLELADHEFQRGKLEEAIKIAHQIPTDISDQDGKNHLLELIQDRVKNWDLIWSKAEKNYQESQNSIEQGDWTEAFRIAVRLLDSGNEYWAKTKYKELSQQIEAARADGSNLDKARAIAERGGVKNILEAIKIAEQIDPKSKTHAAAQKQIKEFGRQLLDLAQAALDKNDWQEAMAIARQIPASAKLKEESEDFSELARAESVASLGTVFSLENAITQAQKVDAKRPLYDKAQTLIAQWRREIADVGNLDQARLFAQKGTLNDLTAAITRAQMVSDNTPKAKDRDREISNWNQQIETIQDRPNLDRAEQLANFGDIAALSAAIEEANQIRAGRALYQEAQGKIQTWRQKIELQEDRPSLDRADQLASFHDASSLVAAIDEANQIRPGRALYQEAQEKIQGWKGQLQQLQQVQNSPSPDQVRPATNQNNLAEVVNHNEQVPPVQPISDQSQTDINSWRSQIQSQQTFDEARRLAAQGTPESLSAAIRKADGISSSSPIRSQVESAMNDWSQLMLAQAQQRSTADVSGAISIAEQIPANTSAYITAIGQIKAWKQLLTPDTSSPPIPKR